MYCHVLSCMVVLDSSYMSMVQILSP
jgi:hypothetical protein